MKGNHEKGKENKSDGKEMQVQLRVLQRRQVHLRRQMRLQGLQMLLLLLR
jgi:hypothetical protein